MNPYDGKGFSQNARSGVVSAMPLQPKPGGYGPSSQFPTQRAGQPDVREAGYGPIESPLAWGANSPGFNRAFFLSAPPNCLAPGQPGAGPSKARPTWLGDPRGVWIYG